MGGRRLKLMKSKIKGSKLWRTERENGLVSEGAFQGKLDEYDLDLISVGKKI